jgi:type IV pilus assembly protein PilO
MTKMSLNNIHEWPLMTRLLLCVLVFFAMLYLGYRFDLSKQILRYSETVQQETDLKQQLELIVNKNISIKNEVSHLPTLQNELNDWQKQLVDYDNLPEVLNQILKIGGDNHLFFSLFTPEASIKVDISLKQDADKTDTSGSDPNAATAPAAAPATATTTTPAGVNDDIYFEKVPIKVVVIGNYHQIADFMSQVANMPWIVVIGDFTISNENKTSIVGEAMAKQIEIQHLLSAEMTLDVYHTGEKN